MVTPLRARPPVGLRCHIGISLKPHWTPRGARVDFIQFVWLVFYGGFGMTPWCVVLVCS